MTTNVTVDHVTGVAVDPQECCNELATLRHLAAGLDALRGQVALMEAPIQEDERRRGVRVQHLGFGWLPPHAEEILPCFFHWFGTSVCNFARLVGFLQGVSSGAFRRDATEDGKSHKRIKQCCDDYVASIGELAPILIWRNKVFAHFAITAPHRDDNAALLDLSAMSAMGYSNGRIRVGGMRIVARGADASLPAWSLTETFELLGPRFWPQEPGPGNSGA